MKHLFYFAYSVYVAVMRSTYILFFLFIFLIVDVIMILWEFKFKFKFLSNFKSCIKSGYFEGACSNFELECFLDGDDEEHKFYHYPTPKDYILNRKHPITAEEYAKHYSEEGD